jgi:phosphinothricin acetyltransferase
MGPEPVHLRDATPEDAGAIAAIYSHYVATTWITFEETPVSAEEMAGRMAEVGAASLPWLVAECEGRVVGYAYATKWKGRCAYRHSVESTVYLDATVTGRGIGKQLMHALLERLRAASKHTVIAGIALPNAASVALHEGLGMRRVATFAEVGFKFGRWIDVAYWQTFLAPGPAQPPASGGAACTGA